MVTNRASAAALAGGRTGAVGARRSAATIVAAAALAATVSGAQAPGQGAPSQSDRERAPGASVSITGAPALGAALTEQSSIAYVSDYVSFAGRDATGFVLFALDTNRGRSEEEYQAEHFVAMFDERAGWIDVPGYESFANDRGALHGYPESPYFELTGEPYALETIRSKALELRLTIGALTERITETDSGTVFSLASGPAVLEWNDRRIEGRVIYEYLAMAGGNRLARGIGGALETLADGPSFQGLYLTSAAREDLYVHLAVSSAASGLGEPLMAFATRSGRGQRIANLVFDVIDYEPALGFYRWPGAWRIAFESDCGHVDVSVQTLSHRTQTNWVLGGFAMRAVTGTLVCGARTVPVYGFAELIR